MDAQFVALVGHVIWPAILFGFLWIFQEPLSNFIQILGTRIRTISGFKFKIELGQLSSAVKLNAPIQGLGKLAVVESELLAIAAGAATGTADYVTIELGADSDQWLTSRLFLLSALLERRRTVKCLVFLQEKRFIGAAPPRDVRSAVAQRFPEYEAALAQAYGTLATTVDNFRFGLSESAVRSLGDAFLAHANIRLPPGQSKEGWVPLQNYSEFARWVSPAELVETIGLRLMTSAVTGDVGPADSDTVSAIVSQSGAFIALVKNDGTFLNLCDRTAVLEGIAKEAARAQTEPPDPKSTCGKKSDR